MKKSTKTLFKITAGISITISILFMIWGVCLIFDIGGIKDIYANMLINGGFIEADEVSFEIFMAISDALIGVFLNSYCAGLYFKLAKSNSILLGGSRLSLYLGIFQCFFVISIIPGVMAIIGSRLLKKEEIEIANRPREITPTDQEIFEQKIKDMKDQKDKGNITQEQFDRFLNEVIEKQALLNIKNGVNNNTDSLQDKLRALKEEKDN